MNEKLIPRKYRKHVISILENYDSFDENRFDSLKEYVHFLRVGAEDGWLHISGNKEYKSIVWLHGIIGLLEG